MNPSTSTAAAPASLLHDVVPPATKATIDNPVAASAPVKVEMVDTIPVKNPIATAGPAEMTAPNPVALPVDHPSSAMAPAAPKGDKELDRVLRTVNRRMKVSDAYEKKQAKRRTIPGLQMDTKLVVPVGVALVVAGALLFLTLSTYRHPQTAIRTRATSGALAPVNR